MVTTTKSTQITNLDAVPCVATTAGEGAPGVLRHVMGTATAPITSGASQAGQNVLRMCRIPSSAKVKEIYMEGAAQTTGSWDCGLYWSDATNDGTPVSLQGAVLSGAQALFASAVDFSSAVARTDKTNESGNYPVNTRNQAVVYACNTSQIGTSLATNQIGGMVDVSLTNTTTVQVAGLMSVEVVYVD